MVLLYTFVYTRYSLDTTAYLFLLTASFLLQLTKHNTHIIDAGIGTKNN